MADVVDFAIALTQRGYAVYPVNVYLDERGKKKPKFKTESTPDGGYVGWEEGRYPTDPDEIREHWQGFQGIAINTEKSGVVGVDIDQKPDLDGMANLRATGFEFPPTPVTASTPSGGAHWLYRVGGIPVDSSGSKLAKGVDIRANGGVLFVEPTVVEGLGAYKFAGMARVDELPTFPDDVAESLRRREVKVSTAAERPTLTMEQRERLQRRMDRVLHDLSTMRDGERNSTMRLRMIRLIGIAMSLGEDLDYVSQLARDAYFESGGTAEDELENFIQWAREHAKFELPEDQTDEAFEAEVAQLMRRANVQEEAKRRLSPLRVESISDDDVLVFDPEATEGDYWVDGLVPKDETVLLFGESTAGKSFAGVDLALGLASGTSVWGRSVKNPVRVLYLAGEGTRRLALRRKAWEVYHQLAPDLVELRRMKLTLASDESVAANQELVRKGEFDVIIVDTFVRASEGLVLENPGEAIRSIAQLDRLRSVRPGATVVALHHPAKSDPTQPAGSYPIRGNVDTILKIKDEEGVRYMNQYKSKEEDQSWSSSFVLQDVRIPGTNLSSAVFVPAGAPSRGGANPWDA